MAKHKKERETSNPIGQKINAVLREKNMVGDYALLAEQFGVAVPSVYGWVDTGRISKSRLPKLRSWSGKPLAWWLDADAEPRDFALSNVDLGDDRWVSICAKSVINLLSTLAHQSALQDEDWLLLQATAHRLAAKTQPNIDPQDLPLEVTQASQQVIDNRVREAQQRSEQTKQQRQPPAKKRAA